MSQLVRATNTRRLLQQAGSLVCSTAQPLKPQLLHTLMYASTRASPSLSHSLVHEHTHTDTITHAHRPTHTHTPTATHTQCQGVKVPDAQQSVSTAELSRESDSGTVQGVGLPLFFKLQKTDFIAVKSSFQTWAPYLQVLERVVKAVHREDGALVFAFINFFCQLCNTQRVSEPDETKEE